MSVTMWFRLLGLFALFVTLGFASPALTQQAKGKKYALLVGVKSYEHGKLIDLNFTENDAEELATVLTKAKYDEVVVLTTTRGAKNDNQKPTKANIDAGLKRLLGKVTKHDLVLIALAGHGVQYEVMSDGKKKDESFFCPSDAKLTDTNDFAVHAKTMLSFRALFKQLDDSGAGSRLLLVDACRNEVGSSRNADIDAMPTVTRGTAALFACKGGERAFETKDLGKGHGIFFYHVIEALKEADKSKDKQVTWDDLTRHVRRGVQQTVPKYVGGGAKQTPELLARLEGDPVLLATVEGAIVEAGKKDKEKPGTKEIPGRVKKEKGSGNQGMDGTVEFKEGKALQQKKAKLVEVVKSVKQFDNNDKVIGYDLTLRYVGGDEIPGIHRVSTAEIVWEGKKGGKGRLDPAKFERGTKLAVVIEIKKGAGEGGEDQVMVRRYFSDKSFKAEK